MTKNNELIKQLNC